MAVPGGLPGPPAPLQVPAADAPPAAALRPPSTAAGVAWLLLAAVFAINTYTAAAAVAGGCAAQLAAAATAAGTSVATDFVDPATPGDACTAQLCTGAYEECSVDAPPLSSLQVRFGAAPCGSHACLPA